MAPCEFAIDGLTCQMRQVRKRAIPDGSPLCLVIFRQENCAVASVCLGDEPEFDAVAGVIHGPKTPAFNERELIGCAVFFAHVAPIAGLMPPDCKQDVLLRQSVERVRRGYDLAKPEFGN